MRIEETRILIPCWWECKTVQVLWEPVWWFLNMINTESQHDPAITPRDTPKETKHRCSDKSVYTNVQSSTIHDSQAMDHPRCPLSDEWMNNMVYPYNWVLSSHWTEGSIDTCYNVNHKHVMLTRRSQSRKSTDYMTLFLWNALQNRQIYRQK